MSKEFLIIGNGNAVTYKTIIDKIKKNELRLGVTKGVGGHFWMIANKEFNVIDASIKEKDGHTLVDISLACWFTNMKNERGKEMLVLANEYSPEAYPKYDNYDAIEVGKVKDIPKDYYGVMGVPFSFIDKYCPSQFQILGVLNPKLKGKWKYKRMLIKRKTKKFLIIGNKNAITYKEIFPYIKNNQLWCGVRSFSGGMWFVINDETDCNTTKVENNQLLGNVASCWFTNIPHTKRNTKIDLYRKYNEKDFPKYDNYNAIECGKVSEIPEDYDGVIGVPITFLDKYCPTQFQIVDAREVALYDKQKNKQTYLIKDADGSINGKNTYARLLIKRKIKKFLILGNNNAITYKEIFPYIKNNELWLGMNWVKEFIQPNKEIKKFGNICWFTNVENPKRNQPLDLYRKYNPTDYPKYDNYDAIEVSKVTDIPEDYNGVMGVPITFLDKYCPTQFEIVGCADADITPNGWAGMTKQFVELYYHQGNTGSYKEGNRLACYIDSNGNAKVPYKRILIKKI